jgi:hypothetical protein
MTRSLGAAVPASVIVLQCCCAAAVAQQKCPFDASNLVGNQVYFFDGHNGQPLADSSTLEGRIRSVTTLYYVVRTQPDRGGAIVIKSARFGTVRPDDDPSAERVALSRQDLSPRCDPKKLPFSGSVLTKAYREYHDRGQDSGWYLGTPDENGQTGQNKLAQFHVSYETTDKACNHTAAKTNPDGTYNARSNRSQFSFDTGIVDEGFSSVTYMILADLGRAAGSYILPAYAEPEKKLREHRVEIKLYRTSGGYACIPFKIQTRGTAQVLRVNDLEYPRFAIGLTEWRVGPTKDTNP